METGLLLLACFTVVFALGELPVWEGPVWEWKELVNASCDKPERDITRAENVTAGAPKLETIPGFHMMSSGSPPVAEAGYSWYQRVMSLLVYEEEDKGFFTSSFGTGGAWFSRQGMHDPPTVCPCSNFKCCSKQKPDEQDKCGWLFESFEGGAVVGIMKLPSRFAKWQPGDSTGCYSAYTQSALFHTGNFEPHSCSWKDSDKKNPNHKSSMGLIQLSNSFLLFPDGVTFEKEGLFGNANVRSPFGKLNATDPRNFWTLVFDSTNFAGPVAYFIPEFWSLRGKGREEATKNFKDFSNVPEIGMSSPGWEALNMLDYKDGDISKLQKMEVPYTNGRSVLWMSQKAHSNKEVSVPLEQALSEGKLDPSKLMANGVSPKGGCSKTSKANFGNQATIGTLTNSMEQGDCVWALKVDNDKCADNGMCSVPEYYQGGKPVAASKASAALQKQRFPTKDKTTGAYDALKTAPYGGCLDSPGPSDKTLYCSKTVDDTWVGYRWYRFVDQPGLQQAHLTDVEKKFMQTRVETLHKMIPASSPISQWIPRGKAADEGLATLDSGALVTPPKGLEHGHVPIVLYQGFAKPAGC